MNEMDKFSKKKLQEKSSYETKLASLSCMFFDGTKDSYSLLLSGL